MDDRDTVSAEQLGLLKGFGVPGAAAARWIDGLRASLDKVEAIRAHGTSLGLAKDDIDAVITAWAYEHTDQIWEAMAASMTRRAMGLDWEPGWGLRELAAAPEPVDVAALMKRYTENFDRRGQ